MSSAPHRVFVSSANLVNILSPQVYLASADLMEWNGTGWTGANPNANVSIAPPSDGYSCRAIFMGGGDVAPSQTWFPGGEGFGLRLDTGLTAGVTYSFKFNYVSHGLFSNGSFSPLFYTNFNPEIISSNAILVGNLPPAGYNWTVDSITFTATAAQTGHNWIILHNGNNGSAGMFSSMCRNCMDTAYVYCNVDLGKDQIICAGDELVLNTTVVPANVAYLWPDSSSLSTYLATMEGNYWVNISVPGCTDSDTIHVDVKDCEVLMALPNVFSPNGDGVNDYFIPVRYKNIQATLITVYNRWGEEVYSGDIREGWDGKNKGKDCPDGVYFWLLHYIDLNWESVELKGVLTLAR